MGSVFLFIGVFLGIYYKFEILGFAFLFLFSNAIVLIYSFIICSWKFFLPKIKFNWDFSKSCTKNYLYLLDLQEFQECYIQM